MSRGIKGSTSSIPCLSPRQSIIRLAVLVTYEDPAEVAIPDDGFEEHCCAFTPRELQNRAQRRNGAVVIEAGRHAGDVYQHFYGELWRPRHEKDISENS